MSDTYLILDKSTRSLQGMDVTDRKWLKKYGKTYG